MDTIYLTKAQIAALYKLSTRSAIGVQIRSTASDESVACLNSVLAPAEDGAEGYATIAADGTGGEDWQF